MNITGHQSQPLENEDEWEHPHDGSVCMLYIHGLPFTINIAQMLAYVPYMEHLGSCRTVGYFFRTFLIDLWKMKQLIPVVPARGGAEVALDLIIRPFHL